MEFTTHLTGKRLGLVKAFSIARFTTKYLGLGWKFSVAACVEFGKSPRLWNFIFFSAIHVATSIFGQYMGLRVERQLNTSIERLFERMGTSNSCSSAELQRIQPNLFTTSELPG
jgi:hypothetical protein